MPTYMTVLHAAAAAKAIYKNLDGDDENDADGLTLLGGFFDPKNDDRLGWHKDKGGGTKDAGGGSAGIYRFTPAKDQFILSYRGSKGAKDWKVDDVQIGLNNQQVDRAHDCILYAMQCKEQYKGAQILVVGHSLGGFLAQVVGVVCDMPFITFNAPGAGRALGTKAALSFKRGANLRVNWDPVSRVPGQHIGPLITIPHYGVNIFNAHTGAAFMKSVKRSRFCNQEAISFIDEVNRFRWSSTK